MWIFPANIIPAFSDVYILTFMFEGSHIKHFFDINNLTYNFFFIGNEGNLYSGRQNLSEEKHRLSKLINLYNGNLNLLGEKDSALCSTWYDKNMKNGLVKVVANNAYNYLHNKCSATAENAMYTTFADVKKKYPVKSFANSFVSCNLRATNDYRGKCNLCYMINVFDNPYVLHYFADYGTTINQDAIALNQLLQWIWRSTIREGNEINLYIPSKRMRT